MDPYARQDLRRITASLDNSPLGVFDTFSGGGGTSEDVKHARGGGSSEHAMGGRQTRENITIGRDFDADRDDIHWMESRRGKGKLVVTDQPLDEDYNPKGKARVYTGKLLNVTPGEADANSGDVDLLELEMSCDADLS